MLRTRFSNAAAATPARLLLIRHGQTATNTAAPGSRMSGWTDFPMSSAGWEQVRALAARLRSHPAASAIYSSPSQRARHTARALAECSRSPLRILDELREIHCGAAEGMRIADVQQHYRRLWEENLRQDNEHFRWPGGESYAELRARSLQTIAAIASDNPGGRVLVVTHCGFISQVVGYLQGASPAAWERFRPENTSLTEIEWSGQSGRLIHFNDHAHLQRLADTRVAAA